MITAEELLLHCAQREEIMLQGKMTNGERLVASLAPEMTEEQAQVLAEVIALHFLEELKTRHSMDIALTAMMMGIEVGRELERRV